MVSQEMGKLDLIGPLGKAGSAEQCNGGLWSPAPPSLRSIDRVNRSNYLSENTGGLSYQMRTALIDLPSKFPQSNNPSSTSHWIATGERTSGEAVPKRDSVGLLEGSMRRHESWRLEAGVQFGETRGSMTLGDFAKTCHDNDGIPPAGMTFMRLRSISKLSHIWRTGTDGNGTLGDTTIQYLHEDEAMCTLLVVWFFQTLTCDSRSIMWQAVQFSTPTTYFPSFQTPLRLALRKEGFRQTQLPARDALGPRLSGQIFLWWICFRGREVIGNCIPFHQQASAITLTPKLPVKVILAMSPFDNPDGSGCRDVNFVDQIACQFAIDIGSLDQISDSLYTGSQENAIEMHWTKSERRGTPHKEV
ncbi:hypothetical protein JB92DRAFT_2828089 [Gautieria morchelliformis]|nr:hypothetical protein JB92DRAFT_2828089 [Gautieria morchelliformis]